MTLYNISATPVQLIAAGDGNTLIINRDSVNPLYIGDNNGIASKITQNSGISIIDPLGSMSFSGLIDVWGVTGGPVVTTDVQKDAVNWSASPAQIAAQIALNGIPLLAGQSVIASVSNLNCPVGGSTPIAAGVAVNQVSYAIEINTKWVGTPVDGMNLRILLTWFDKTNVTVTEEDEFTIGAEQAAGLSTLTVLGTGPAKGNAVSIQIINTDTTSAATVSANVYQSSIVTSRDRWRTSNTGVVPGYPVTASQLGDNTQNPGYRHNPSLASSTSETVLFALCNGNAWFSCNSPSTSFLVQLFPTPFTTFSSLPYFSITINNTNIDRQITLPRCPVLGVFTNLSGATQPYNVFMTAWE